MNPYSNPQAAKQYLRTRVMTATPEQLHMMLFDGAVRFAEQARAGLEQNNREQKHQNIVRVQDILTELLSSLRPDTDPELCTRLQQLYRTIYKQLVDANINADIQAMEGAIELLKIQRDTWAMLVEQIATQRLEEKGRHKILKMPPANMPAERLSMTA